MKNTDDMYEYLTEDLGINTDAVDLVAGIYGYNEDVMYNILYYYTGDNSFPWEYKEAEA